MLALSTANSDVRAAISAGEVSASTAVKIVKQHGAKAGTVIADGSLTRKTDRLFLAKHPIHLLLVNI